MSSETKEGAPDAPAEPPKPARPKRTLRDALLDPAWLVAIGGIMTVLATNSEEISNMVTAWSEKDVRASEVQLLEQRQAFIVKAVANDYGCMTSPELYYANPDEVQVDATICEETGDILLRLTAQGGTANAMSVVFIDDHLRGSNVQVAQAGVIERLIGLSRAHALPSLDMAPTGPGEEVAEELAQQLKVTVCQKIEADERTLIRHVRIGTQCYDETWDTFTGVMTESVPVSCRTSCE